jgi:hypothetical protein
MSDENTALHAPDRPTASAGALAGGITLAAAAGTAAAAWVMMMMAPDASLGPDLVELAKQQQLAVAALANIGVTTVVATAVNVARNWLYARGLGQ